jgi:primosomal protein N' (replication factor Y)
MIIEVSILNGFSKPLSYSLPLKLKNNVFIGSIVQVPLRTTIVAALVIGYKNSSKKRLPFKLKEVIDVEPLPEDKTYYPLIQKLAFHYQTSPIHFAKRIRDFIKKQKQNSTHKEIKKQKKDSLTTIDLTSEQMKAYMFINSYLKKQTFCPTVLHGVTGSGKTEIYKKLIQSAKTYNKSTILLLPEVTLALQFQNIMQNELPTNIPIYGFHSAATLKEKRALWETLVNKKPTLIIGVHLPILLPIHNLGAIIIDEEHDQGYQEKKHPKVNTKHAALIKAKLNDIPIIFGSATPSLATLHNVKTKNWPFFQIKKRFAGAFPSIKTVSLLNKKKRPNFWITKELEHAIQDRLAMQEQSILFLNRRGFSFFVQCSSCSFVFSCCNCSVSLTLHENNQLFCHYCSSTTKLPFCCPSCQKDSKTFLKKGVGTQQIVNIIQKIFPLARIARADHDTTKNRRSWRTTMEQFTQGDIDILIGTQTITKGFHFPNVTLVGILWADLNLHFPFYNAAETTLQQLIQVAGRAGRSKKESLVIVQTMTEHPIFSHLNETDYLTFYAYEIKNRTTIGYPPIRQLAEIELKSSDELLLEQEAMKLKNALLLHKQCPHLLILGPAKPPVSRIKNIYSRKLYLKGKSLNDLTNLFQSIKLPDYSSSIFFTPNPMC